MICSRPGTAIQNRKSELKLVCSWPRPGTAVKNRNEKIINMLMAGNCRSKQKRKINVHGRELAVFQNRKTKINIFMAGNCRSIKKERKKPKTTVSRQKSQVSFLFFFLERQFPAMNTLILVFLF